MRRLRGLQVVGLAAGEAAADGAEHFFRVRVGGVGGVGGAASRAAQAVRAQFPKKKRAPLGRGFFMSAAMSAAMSG